MISRDDFNPVDPDKCKCGHIACVCNIEQNHAVECKFRIAATGSVAIECDHGYDVCPICDPCTCDPEQ